MKSLSPVPVLTIDGPSASGKGVVARQVAQHLGFHVLDSGMLYRLVALASLRDAVAPENVAALTQLATAADIICEENRIELDGEDVSQAIRDECVSRQASAIAVHPPVRAALIARQRAARVPPGLVADGRDMGTVIFPDADLKIFLTADIKTRAERRYMQLSTLGFSASMEDILREVQARDIQDRARAVAPLEAAADAKVLDTTCLRIDEVVATVLGWFASRLPGAQNRAQVSPAQY